MINHCRKLEIETNNVIKAIYQKSIAENIHKEEFSGKLFSKSGLKQTLHR